MTIRDREECVSVDEVVAHYNSVGQSIHKSRQVSSMWIVKQPFVLIFIKFLDFESRYEQEI